MVEREPAGGPDAASEVVFAAVVAFHIDGHTALADALDLVEARRTLERYLEAVLPAVAEHGGEVFEIAGDEVLALFPLEDDPVARARAAIAAAAEALERLERADTGRLRGVAALHAGVLLDARHHPREQRGLTAVGATVNEVRRLSQLARPLDCDLLLTDAMRVAAGAEDLDFLGAHRLPGTPLVRHLYTLAGRKDRPLRAGDDRIDTDDAESTLLAGIVGTSRARSGALRLFGEGLFFTAIAIFLALRLAHDVAGFISVCLASAGLAFRLNGLLLENRDNIYVHLIGGWAANRRTAAGVCALFAGMLVAYALAVVIAGPAETERSFGHVLEVTSAGDGSILGRSFGSFWPLLGHNALVLVGFFLLAFVYWTYGALVAIAWNACAWGVTLTVLVLRGVSDPSASGLDVAVATVRVVPHLVLEGVAYVLASLAAIFQSKAVVRYAASDPVFRRVARAAGTLLALAAAALTAAALAEAYVAS